MTRNGALVCLLFLLAGGITLAQSQQRPLLVSIRPAFEIPLAPDHLLFELSGGATVGARYALPKLPFLSIGPSLSWQLARMQHVSLGSLGTLSVFAAEATAELRSTFRRPIDLFLAGGVGWFYALRNESPAQWAANLSLSARAGIGIRLSPPISIGLGVEYHRFVSLYHTLGIAIGTDLRLGGTR